MSLCRANMHFFLAQEEVEMFGAHRKVPPNLLSHPSDNKKKGHFGVTWQNVIVGSVFERARGS